jgi:hypothetical protein
MTRIQTQSSVHFSWTHDNCLSLDNLDRTPGTLHDEHDFISEAACSPQHWSQHHYESDLVKNPSCLRGKLVEVHIPGLASMVNMCYRSRCGLIVTCKFDSNKSAVYTRLRDYMKGVMEHTSSPICSAHPNHGRMKHMSGAPEMVGGLRAHDIPFPYNQGRDCEANAGWRTGLEVALYLYTSKVAVCSLDTR